MFSREIFSSRLSMLRKSAGMTTTQLAESCGVTSYSTISLLENAKRSPSVELLCALADNLNVSVDYLLGNDVQQPGADPLVAQIQQLDCQQRSDVKKYVDYVLSEVPMA